MPPKVKPGNAASSNLAKGEKTPPQANQEKPLFPPGSKYPLSLLHER